MIKKIKKNQKGVAALLTVVVIAAATLIMAYSAVILGVGDLEMGYDSQQGSETLSLAEGCVEEALRQLKLDSGYSGDTLSLGDGSCIITVVSSVNDRTITVTGTIGEYNKKVEVDVTLSGSDISLNSWEEVE